MFPWLFGVFCGFSLVFPCLLLMPYALGEDFGDAFNLDEDA